MPLYRHVLAGQWECSQHLVDWKMKRPVAHSVVQTQQISCAQCGWVDLHRFSALETKLRATPFNTPLEDDP